MPEPRFTVDEGEIVDLQTRQIVSPETFNRLSTPAEKSIVEAQLRATGGLAESPALPVQTETPSVAPSASPSSRTPPNLEEFLQVNGPANPDYTTDELTTMWEQSYGPRGASLPSLDEFLAANTPANPDYTEAELKGIWEERYGSRGALPTQPGPIDTLIEGFKQTAREISAYARTLHGDTAGVERLAQEPVIRGRKLEAFLQEFEKQKKALGPDGSWLDAINLFATQAVKDPVGAGYFALESGIPSSAAILGAAGVATLAGGPIAGLAALFGGDIVLETGAKALEKAREGFTPQERAEALQEGAIKGATVGTLDIGSLGLTKWLTGTATRAVERATARVLEEEGIDVADRLAVEAASKKPEIVDKVRTAQTQAYEGVTTLAQRATRGGAEVGIESLGEGAGEYFGELAATGQGDKMEALAEAFLGLGQSLGEIGAVSVYSRAERQSAERGLTEAEKLEQTNAAVVGEVFSGTTVDEVIKKASDVVEQPPIGTTQLDQFIAGQQTTGYTDTQRAIDQAAYESVFAGVGTPIERSPSGEATFDGVPIRVLDPATLPVADANLTQEKFKVISTALGAMGNRLVLVDSGSTYKGARYDGITRQSQQPNVVFIANTTSADATAVAFHEAAHLMEGSPLYDVFLETVQRNLRPNVATIAATQRHGVLSEKRLLSEIGADITGDAMSDPVFMKKVFRELELKVGAQKALGEAQTFLDKIKELLTKVKDAFTGLTFLTPSGRRVADLYVKNLEQVHDALATAIADIYARAGKPAPTTSVSSKEGPAASRVLLAPDVSRAFAAIGAQQRGEAESVMLKVQRTYGGGVLNPVVEHAGDLIHRMTHMAEHGMALQPYVQEKVDRVLKYLTHAYGFDKELRENIEHNVAYDKRDTVAERTLRVNNMLARYAAAHAAIPVYNRPQWLARAASVAIGRRQWDEAVQWLKELKTIADSKTFDQQAFAVTRDAKGALRTYREPIAGSLIGVTPEGEVKVGKDAKFILTETKGPFKAGENVTQSIMRQRGYEVTPADVITEKESLEPQKPALSTKQTELDTAAHEAATSPRNDRPEPTEGQIEAGNYKKGHITVAGLEISIENPEGSTRSGVDPYGKAWSQTMTAHYGYILGTVGHDKEHLDVFVKPGTPEDFQGPVFVISQTNPKTGKFDEYKVILGVKTSAEAKALYLSNYAKDWKGFQAVKQYTLPEFNVWMKANATYKKEVSRGTTPKEQSVSTVRSEQRAENVSAEPSRPYQEAGRAGRPLAGLPGLVRVDGELIQFTGFKPAQDAAETYMKESGRPYTPETVYHPLNKERATRIATAYDQLEHRPNDPEVKRAYRAMIDEVIAQYRAILETGLKVEFIKGADPYNNPRHAILDVVKNNHLWVFSTRDGFGSDATFDPSSNPLLEETAFTISGQKALANDLFRIVHDYFGHIKDGVGFRAEGEDNAWYSHVRMFSPLAARAMTTETRGQNSWVNFGPYGEQNRSANPAETHYADQKTNLLPEWAMEMDGPQASRSITLEHYSRSANLAVIDPAFHGTGQAGAEQRRQAAEPEMYVPRTYYYRAGQQPEPRFKGLTKYRVEVPEGRLVDLATMDGKTATEKEWNARQLGYLGYYMTEGSGKGTVAIFEPLSTTETKTRQPQGFVETDHPVLSPAPMFYSQAERVLVQKLPGRVTREQLQNILSSQLIKREEVEWIGLDDFAKTQESFSKQEVLDFVKANQLEILEIERGSFSPEKEAKISEYRRRAREINDLVDRGGQISWREGFQRRVLLLYELSLTAIDVEATAGMRGDVKFWSWVLPGGENYREFLLQLPIKTETDQYTVRPSPDVEGEWDVVHPTGRILYSTTRESDAHRWLRKEQNRSLDEAYTYQSPHWSEPNVLAHVRMNDRTGMNGEKILFLEEIQSDWHQAGKKQGYAEEEAVLKQRRDAAIATQRATRTDSPEYERVSREAEEAERDWLNRGAGIPNAPFKKTWHEFALRRMLRYAAETGYETLAWTTGEQQAARYDLSKHIQALRYRKNGDGEFELMFVTQDGDERTLGTDINETKLSEYVGKDVAEKIMRGDGERIALMPDEDGPFEHYRELRNLDLKVGGEGMKGFYDKIIPEYLNKYAKKWGAKVGHVGIPTNRVMNHVRLDNGAHQWQILGEKSGVVADFDNENDARAFLKSGVPVHALPITESMKQSVLEEGQPMFSRPISYAVEPPGKLDRTIRVLQDKNVDIVRVVEGIRKAGGAIPDELNPVLKEEMYQKRAEQRATDFTNEELRPLVEYMRLNKITLDEVDQYAQAKHVIVDRVNERLKAINPTLPDNEALSGMTDQEAQRILDAPSQRLKPVFENIMARIDAMVERTRDLMVDYGLETQGTIDLWRKEYQSYVPLRREGFEDEGHPTGTGRSVRGSTVKSRFGSNLPVTDVLANIAQARDQVITRGEKMRPVVAFAGLMMLHPNKELASLDKPAQITMTDPTSGLPIVVPGDLATYKVPRIKRFDPTTGTVVSMPDPRYKGRDNVVNFRIKGIDYAIVFNERNERAMEVAKAFKELDTGKLTGVMKAVAPYTRYLASVNTQYNPIFGIVNFVRDAQFAMLTLGSTPLAGKQATVLKNAISSLSGIFQDARDARYGLHPSSATAQLWERFQHVGGPTGYRDLFFTSTERAAEIQRMLDPNNWRNLVSPIGLVKRLEESGAFKLLSDYNLTMENSIRLGVFKTAVESGMSDLQAASLAKNITVNFNKRGQIGAQAGSLYAFFNANVQGTARIIETLFEKMPDGRARLSTVGKKIVAGGILLGVLQTFLLAMAGFDDNDPPEYIKARNFVIPIPGTDKGYITIPMPLGFNLLPNVGRLAAETVRAYVEGRPARITERGFALLSSMYNTLSPTGGSGGLIQELSPTVIDPFVALAANKDWTGKSISREDISSLKPTPGHTRAHDTATVWAMTLSRGINWATGGTDYIPGVLSPTPDAIDYLIQQATGGVGREVSKFAQVARGAVTGEEVPLYKIPLAGRFIGSATGSASVRERFYDTIKAVNLAAEEVKGRALHREEFKSYLRQNPEARFEKSAVSIQRTINDLKKQKQRMIDANAPRDAVRLQDERILQTMTRFNEMVDRARKERF